MEARLERAFEGLRPPKTVIDEMLAAARKPEGWDIPGILSGALELSQGRLTDPQKQWLRGFGKEEPIFRRNLRQEVGQGIIKGAQERNREEVVKFLILARILGIADSIDKTPQERKFSRQIYKFLDRQERLYGISSPSRKPGRVETALALAALGLTGAALAAPLVLVGEQYLRDSQGPNVRAADKNTPLSPTTTSTPLRPTVTSTPTPKPEIRVLPKDLLREQIAPEIYRKVLKMREEKGRSDSDFWQRINPELNKDRINMVVLGGRQGDALTDTILILSYHLPSHTVSLLSIPRDLQSPEVLRKTGSPVNSRINQAFGEGGFDLAKLALENATGLSADLTMRVNFDVLVDLIDQTVGYVEISLAKAINDPTYPALEGSGYEPFFISAGEHRLDGYTALKIARSRHGSSDYDRAERQRAIVMAFFKRVLEEGRNNPLKGAQMILTINGILQQKAKEGTFQPDFDIGMLLLPDFGKLIQDTPAMLWQQAFGGGWKITEEPTVFSAGIDNKNYVVGAGVPGAAITKIRNGNSYSSNPRRDYWLQARRFTENFLR